MSTAFEFVNANTQEQRKELLWSLGVYDAVILKREPNIIAEFDTVLDYLSWRIIHQKWFGISDVYIGEETS